MRRWPPSSRKRSATKSALAVFVSVTVCLIPAILRADDGPVPLKYKGKPGFWVPRSLFLDFEHRYEDHPKLTEKLREKTIEAESKADEAAALSTTASIADARRALFEDAYHAERKARRKADEDALKAAERAWHESRALWFAVGVVSAVGIFVAVGYLVPDRVLAPGG